MSFIRILLIICVAVVSVPLWGASELAPAIPNLSLPEDNEPVVQKAPAQPVSSAKKIAKKKKKATKPPVTETEVKVNTEDIFVEALPLPIQPVIAETPVNETISADAQSETAAVKNETEEAGDFVPARETKPVAEEAVKQKEPRVVYNPTSKRDPTLSPDDRLLLKAREEARLRAIEAEKQRKLDEERKRLAELERQRQLELERLRDPSREIRGKITINGIIGQEVFIGDKVYTVGKTVLGARIVRILPDSVVFVYKGQQFTKKVKLK